MGTYFEGPSGIDPIINPARILVRYKEVEHSPRLRFGDNSSEVIREFYVNWDADCITVDPNGGTTYFDAVRALVGFPIMTNANGSWYISRYLPDSMPLLTAANPFLSPAVTNRPYLWCRDADVRDHVSARPGSSNLDAAGVYRYEVAIIRATYKTATFRFLDDESMANNGWVDGPGNPDESTFASELGGFARFVSLTINPTASHQSLPTNTMVYVSDGTAVKSSQGVVELNADLSIQHHQVPRPAVGLGIINPWIRPNTDEPIRKCLGALNQTDFVGAKKGTLELTSVTIKPIVSLLGDDLFDIDYRFKWFDRRSRPTYTTPGGAPAIGHAYGHVMILRPDAQGGIGEPLGVGYDEIVTASGITPGPQPSNYLLPNPRQSANLFRWAEMRDLLRPPFLIL